ncbi:helix-turn-helix domain-containing protein [Streptacidiphilus sp. 4-A2]|nr:helix-turn-helix domain-containing protein [Streptacidiphilus sp. 4-A2]
MGRKQRDLDPSSGPVAEFAARLRALRQASGNPTFATMSRRAHRSVSVLSEAAGGVELPSWATVEAFVHACGHTDAAHWREPWERARAALDLAAPPRDPDPPPAPVPPAGAPATAAVPGPPPVRRRPVTGARLRTLAAMVLGVAIGWAGATGLSSACGCAPAASAPTPMPSVVVVTPPSPLPLPPAGSSCDTRTQWVYQFAQNYEGQVYVLLSTPTRRAPSCGDHRPGAPGPCTGSVTVYPGEPSRGWADAADLRQARHRSEQSAGDRRHHGAHLPPCSAPAAATR